MVCLQSRMGGQMIKDLGDAVPFKMESAPPADRTWASQARPETPVWITDELGWTLNIAEPSPERCEIHAFQLPVDRTFSAVGFALAKAFPDFKPVHVNPGYDPIVYQWEAVSGDSKYIIHMEGAEPGTPQHWLRFSMLYAYVLRQPGAAVTNNPAGRP